MKFKFCSKYLFVILPLVLVIFLAGCGGGLITPTTDEAIIKVDILAVDKSPVDTDLPDYSPGDYVLVTGSGWIPGETVKLDFLETLSDLISQQTITYYTVVDSEGNISDSQYLIELRHLGATFILTATGQTSGLVATTTFTDAVTLTGVYPSDSSGTAKDSFLTTDNVYAAVTTGGASGANNVRLYVLNHVPSNGENLDSPTSKDVSGGYESETPDQSNHTFTYMVWNNPEAGIYYIVLDGGNGIFGGSDFLSISFTVTGGGGPPETADVTFDQTGVGTDFTGTVLTVDSTDYDVGDLPVIFTWDVDSEHTFAYASPLVVDGKRYVWTSTTTGLTTDQSGTITVPEEGGTVTGNYKTQYYLTLVTNPANLTTPSGEDWYDADTEADISTDNPVGTYFFAGWTTDDQDEIAEQYALSTTVLMDKAKTVTADYQAMTPGTGGKTLGFWSNKNGQSYIGDDDLSFLRYLDLVDKDGLDFDPGNYAAFKTWLLKADAVKMGYMLSAQLAATELSVYNGLLSGSQEVWVDDGDGIFEPGEALTINSIMTDANDLTGSSDRAAQERAKNLLDKINNNQLWFLVP